MTALLVWAAMAVVLAVTWRRRGHGLLPLGVLVLVLAPIAAVGWIVAAFSRWRLARPGRVRAALAQTGIDARGRSIAVRRIAKGDMNAVFLVTLDGDVRIVLKVMLRFGTLLAWSAREFGATREYPRALGRTARTLREVRAMTALRREGIAAPRCLGSSVRDHVVAMEYVEGPDLSVELARDGSLAVGLGRLLARMHAAQVSMGDANPRNMVVDRAGRIVPLDFELSHAGSAATATKKGFDLAWATAFLPDDRARAACLAAYDEPLPERELAAARAHLASFSPLIERFARRWRIPPKEVAS